MNAGHLFTRSHSYQSQLISYLVLPFLLNKGLAYFGSQKLPRLGGTMLFLKDSKYPTPPQQTYY